MTIGLIGGLSTRAGVYYYEQIAHHYASERRRLELVFGHADLDTVLSCVTRGDKAELGWHLGSIANRLFDAGAEFVAISAVAPHIAVDEIARVARGPLSSILPLIPTALNAAGADRVGVFGNRAVMETGLFGTIPEPMLVRPTSSVLDDVHGLYNDIALSGKQGTARETRLLDRIARHLIEHGGAQSILLAGTDLSSFYAKQAPGYLSIDVARLHIAEIVRRATPTWSSGGPRSV